MSLSINKSGKQSSLILILKILVIGISFGFIGFKIQQEIRSGYFFEEFKQVGFHSYIFIAVSLVLVFANWGLEALKWKRLVRPLQTIRFGQSFRAVLAGITVSVFTPNRVGEFGGRIMVLDRNHRVEGIFATLLGGFSQLLVTLLLGLAALPVYMFYFPDKISIPFSETWIWTGGFFVFGMGIWIFFRSGRIVNWFMEQRKQKHWERFIAFITRYSFQELTVIFLLSLIRYLVFTIQFYFLLRFLGIQASLISILSAIALVYLVMTVIPTVAVAEFGIRGSVAVFFLGVFTPYSTGIVMASILLWMINLALPAMAGSLVIAKLKI